VAGRGPPGASCPQARYWAAAPVVRLAATWASSSQPTGCAGRRLASTARPWPRSPPQPQGGGPTGSGRVGRRGAAAGPARGSPARPPWPAPTASRRPRPATNVAGQVWRQGSRAWSSAHPGHPVSRQRHKPCEWGASVAAVRPESVTVLGIGRRQARSLHPGTRSRSFPRSFHQAPLAPTGPHWLDDAPDLSSNETTPSTPWTIHNCLVTNCHAKSALFRRGSVAVSVAVHQPPPDRTLAVQLDPTPWVHRQHSGLLRGPRAPRIWRLGVRIPRGAPNAQVSAYQAREAR